MILGSRITIASFLPVMPLSNRTCGSVQSPRMSQGSVDGDVPEVISQVPHPSSCRPARSAFSHAPPFSLSVEILVGNILKEQLNSILWPLAWLAAEVQMQNMQAQARLWEGLTGMAEHLDNLNAVVRELVVRRYRPIDIKRVEAGEYGDVDEIQADEDPEFQLQYQKNRFTYLCKPMTQCIPF